MRLKQFLRGSGDFFKYPFPDNSEGSYERWRHKTRHLPGIRTNEREIRLKERRENGYGGGEGGISCRLVGLNRLLLG